MHCLQDASAVPAAAQFGAGAYAAGDAIGTPFELGPLLPGNNALGKLLSVVLTDLDKQSAAMDLLLFKSQPATVPTDNSALDLADSDLPLVVGVVSIAAEDYCAAADNGVAVVKDLQLPFRCTERSLWGQLVSRGTPTYTTAAPLRVTIYAGV